MPPLEYGHAHPLRWADLTPPFPAGGLAVGSDLTVAGDLRAGDVALTGDLVVGGATTLAGLVTTTIGLTAGGLVTASNGITIGGALDHDGSTVGFYGTAPVAKPTVTGSRGANAALASLLTALASLGLLTDASS